MSDQGQGYRIGFRAFALDGSSKLRGIHQPGEWIGDANIARCMTLSLAPETVDGCRCRYEYVSYLWTLATTARLSASGSVNQPHDVVCVNCGCGFWALNSPSQLSFTLGAEYMVKCRGRVRGIIVGWGRIMEFNQGFRCQYARIVALAKEDIEGSIIKTIFGTSVPQRYHGARIMPFESFPLFAAELGGSKDEITKLLEVDK